MAYIRPPNTIFAGVHLTSTPGAQPLDPAGVIPVTLSANVATATTLGVVVPGSGLGITANGVLFTTGITGANVTIVTTTPYTASATDYFIGADVAGPSEIDLPASSTGTTYVIKDVAGTANTDHITVMATTTIDGQTNAVIDINYASITVLFNGSEWNII